MQAPGSILTPANRPPVAFWRRLRQCLLRKLWLPRGLYESIPYLYLLAGIFALASALFSQSWTWILPYVVLLGLICLHAGLGILALRYRFRREQRRRPMAPREGARTG
jgi:hypothetical protein